MKSDNLNINENSFKDQSAKFEPFATDEIELLQFIALQVENVIAPTLKKYELYYYIRATNEIADAFLKNPEMWCDGKRKEI